MENSYYNNLITILKERKLYDVDVISALIDEGNYHKNIAEDINNDIVDVLINSIATMQSLLGILLGAVIIVKNESDIIFYFIVFIILFLLSVLFNWMVVDLEKNKAKDFYSKANCFDIYLGYLYRIRRYLSINK